MVAFADINETFLNHTTNRLADARDIFAAERIAVVLSSSMTRAQIQLAQQDLGIREPFICESGAAILIPDDYFPFDVLSNRELPGYHVIEFGRPYREIVAGLHRIAGRLNIPVVGFSDETVEQVAQARGLSLSHARLAKLREYDEPFRLVRHSREAHERLWRSLRASGLALISCGSTEHVGAPVSRIAAAQLLSSLYRRTLGTVVTTSVGIAVDTLSAPFVRTAFLTTPSQRSLPPPLPTPTRIQNGIDHALWIETIVAVGGAAREEHIASKTGH